MKNSFASLFLSACLVGIVVSECPNACSAHGKCGAYDMCTCYRNWMSNDCSERICQFGLAHVDTPKGDLDSSNGALSGPATTVVLNNAMYPYGTTEQYPFVGDIDGNVLTNTAHEYRECSNKGICDRSTGTCACFEGYDGSACQRASCPVTNGATCSGHGTCQTIEELAQMDHNNLYELWDKDSTMGCLCDGGYGGADCSEKKCKYGIDPLYYDRGSTARYSNFTYILYASQAATTLAGNYSIIFYDSYGEDWQTIPIDWDATCITIVSALEGLPNNVIPAGSVRCYKDTTPTTTDDAFLPETVTAQVKVFNRYTVSFPGNPGKLKQIELTHYLDGDRPTLYTSETTSTLGWYVYSNGFIGEDVDMVPDLCDNVLVTLAGQGDPSNMYLDGIDTQEAKALKTCLGGSDGSSTNNVEVYNWDYGSLFNPHLIKLVDQTQYASTVVTGFDGSQDTNVDAGEAQVPITRLCNPDDINSPLYGTNLCSNKNPAGFFAVLYYHSGHANPWRLLTPAAQDYGPTTTFKVYTTKGYLQLVSPITGVYTTSMGMDATRMRRSFFTNVLHATNTTTFSSTSNYQGWMDCETQTIGQNGLLDCLNKDDFVMFLSGNGTDPAYPNMYQVKRLHRAENSYENELPDLGSRLNSEKIRTTITLDYNVNHKMVYEMGLPNHNPNDLVARVYKFHPDTSIASHGYSYAAPCSNRGNCNVDSGLCECFNGYTNDNCDTINALAQ